LYETQEAYLPRKGAVHLTSNIRSKARIICLIHQKKIVRRREEIDTFLQPYVKLSFQITLSIVPRSSASKFFNTRCGGKVNLRGFRVHMQFVRLLLEATNVSFIPHTGFSCYIAPVFYVSFSAAKPWSVNSECNSLKSSHFSPFHKLPNYIPVLVYLIETTIHANVSLMNRI
jgi:hypothetical protein